MGEYDNPWAGHKKVDVGKLAKAGPGAVGFYDELVESCDKPGATVSTAIDTIDISPETNNVRKVLLQSLHGFGSSAPKDRKQHVKIFVGMLKRLKGEKAVPGHTEEINAAMHNLARECQLQYNKGGTADPMKTAELIEMATAAEKAGCLDGQAYGDIKRWSAAQQKWEASEEGKAFKAQLVSDRAVSAALRSVGPQSVVRSVNATSAPSATPKTSPTATKQPPKKPTARGY